MAGKLSVILLGIEDLPITEKESAFIDFNVNKIGGKPVKY